MQMFPYGSVRQMIIYEGPLQLFDRNNLIKAVVVFRKESAMLSQQLQLCSYKEAVYR